MSISTYLTVIALGISSLALYNSKRALKINSENQLEQRHREILRLRDDNLEKAKACEEDRHNFQGQMECEKYTFCLTSVYTEDFKRTFCELVDKYIGETEKESQEILAKRQRLEELDAKEENTSEVCIEMQEMESFFKRMKKSMSETKASANMKLEVAKAVGRQQHG